MHDTVYQFISHSHTTTPVSYLWNLGNGIVDSTADPSTTYTTPSTFSVSVTATDASGCKVMVSAPGLIHTAKPLVKFTGDTLVCAHQAVSFSNATIGAAHYLWHFGDGDTSSAINPSHVYRSYGRFNVSLTATDSTGCDSTLTKVQFIRVDSAKVDFHVDRAFSFCPPLVTSFRSVVNRSDLRLTWDSGDGYTDTAANPTHIYFHAGVYTVQLIGVSHTGCSDTVTYPQLINVQGPSGHFAVTPDNGCTPLVVTFSGTVSAIPGISPAIWVMDCYTPTR